MTHTPLPSRSGFPFAGLVPVLAVVLWLLTSRTEVSGAGNTGQGEVDFRRDVLPVLSANCFSCHGPDEEARKGKLRLDERADAVRDRQGSFAINPGFPKQSEFIARIRSTDPDDLMPPPKSGHHLEPAQMDVLERWIAQGAEYAEHWAFVPPVRPPVPKVSGFKDRRWARNEVDHFIRERLHAQGLRPSPEADRHTLIRRLSLDLTGLPPTPEELAAFVNDRSPDAYEKVVDRLLKSPHYGERWARVWLDLARYADSAGYGSDPLRMNIWPYRDWVINALNRNLPYDQFTREQMAGDLLPNATPDQIAATAFHRNTMTNTEGGTDDEEFRSAAVKDRIATTMQTWMGITMNCAQCHTHKYDPITQREYYQFYAIFNQTADSDKPNEEPTMPLPTAEQRQQMDRIQAEIAALNEQVVNPPAEFRKELADWEQAQTKAVEWTVLSSATATSTEGVKFETLSDGSLLATGKAPDKDTYTIRSRADLTGVTALRLEVLPDDSLPGKGPGRSSGGNFVLNDLRLAVTAVKSAPKQARYVRVELPGKGRMLSLAEVQVFESGQNLAVKGKATQSSTGFNGPANLAIDGNTDGRFQEARSTTHTEAEDNPWWEVDLGSEVAVDQIVIWNRSDGGVYTRLSDFKVLALGKDRKAAFETTIKDPPKYSLKLDLPGQQNLPLANATASYNQSDFEVAQAVDGKSSDRTGWAIGGATGRAQEAYFELGRGFSGEAEFTLALKQIYGSGHTIGRFRLSVTRNAKPVRILPPAIRGILATARDQRSPDQLRMLADHFRPLAPSLAKLNQQIAAKQKELAAIKPVDLPVMREVATDKRRETRIHVRGNFLDLGEQVEAGFPAAFCGEDNGLAQRPGLQAKGPTRLDVAAWLTSRSNPLTARVAVNRLWAQLFGTGLVKTEEDFGTQGTLPSHPQLLDWLAIEFMDRGWDTKAMLKLLVMSATYRQSSVTTAEHLERDPQAQWLSRYPRRRLDADGVRDQALALSGSLSAKVGGPSVYPPQPDGLWRAAFNGQRDYPTSKGEDRYRRGLYTFWRRTTPYPSMATFDAPSRETCTVRRLPTNTPLQSFVTLNDPVYVEAAQALARRIMKERGASAQERVRFGLELCLVRPASQEQVRALVDLFEQELAGYRADPESARKLATEPLGSLPEGMDAAEAAAWTVVANVLLNLDGVLTKV